MLGKEKATIKIPGTRLWIFLARMRQAAGTTPSVDRHENIFVISIAQRDAHRANFRQRVF
jgi:hypothetical protein